MLAADLRLRRADDFAIVIRRGRRAGRGGLVVHVRAQSAETQTTARVGFVVPRAVGSAVTRNKVRRRLRHLIRAELGRLAPGTDVVVRVLPPAANASYATLSADLAAALLAAARPGPVARTSDRPRGEGDGCLTPPFRTHRTTRRR